MRISRIYLPQALACNAAITLQPEQAHYLRTVLRLQKGAQFNVFDGSGDEYPATVVEASRSQYIIQLGTPFKQERESCLLTHLGIGISRGERMDLALQKAVELGVNVITPLLTERCVVQLDEARKQQRHKHWQKITQSACEQCGRNRLPELREAQTLVKWLPVQQGLRLFLDPHNGKNLRELMPVNAVTVLSGPEGGFSEAERRLAHDAQFTALRLGPRILRTETAALAALAAVQTLWGDLG